MVEQVTISPVFYEDVKEHAAFSDSGPQPRFLLDSERFKVVLAGLEAGQTIPKHPEGMAVYHFLAGTGVMHVNDESYPVTVGATVIVPNGAERGVEAQTRLVFLAAKCE